MLESAICLLFCSKVILMNNKQISINVNLEVDSGKDNSRN
jgi:hypothetical protein